MWEVNGVVVVVDNMCFICSVILEKSNIRKRMRIFILTTGRSGSTTFARACSHIENFTVGHESRWGLIGGERLKYPEQHIEVDNRLAWLLGSLDSRFGNDPFYVHLVRDRNAVANSYFHRRLGRNSIIRAYSYGIIYRDHVTMDECLDYVDTVNENIHHFLKDKTNKMTFYLAHHTRDFPLFWNQISAKGDLITALQEWEIPYNKIGEEKTNKKPVLRGYEKIKRIISRLPEFLKNA